MLYSGLCSITFRDLDVDEVIELAAQANIEGIEWGGDVHVPPGDAELASSVAKRTEAAGLKVCSYGSYYRCDAESDAFGDVLESADALGTGIVRVWAGRKGSADADADSRKEVVEHLRRAVIAAREMDLTVALEYHGDTLTDTKASTHQLLKEVGLPELKLFWQPRNSSELERDLDELKAALPHLRHVHCFNWGPDGGTDKRPLLDGADKWKQFISIIRQSDEDRFVILEFVQDGSAEQFLEDAQVLKSILAE